MIQRLFSEPLRRPGQKWPSFRAFSFIALLALCSCEPTTTEPEGIDLEVVYNEVGEACGQGLAIIESDYLSTNLSIYDFEGRSVAEQFFSSASAPAFLNAALSGDVVLPTSVRADDFVVIDRAQSVLTRLNLTTGMVEAQVQVGDGFFANPQDYLRVAGGAVVTRFEKNPKSGSELFNQGDDLALIDWSSSAVSGVVGSSLGLDEPLSPDRLLKVDQQLWVSILGFSPGFTDAADARWLILNAESFALEQVLTLRGLRNCKGLALSPNKERVAVSCTGLFEDANASAPKESALVIFNKNSKGSWQQERRLESDVLKGGPFGFHLFFASEQLVVSTVFGALEGADAGRPDRLFQWSLDVGEAKFLDEGQVAFSLSSPTCSVACRLCFIADAESASISRFEVTSRGLEFIDRFSLASGLGLPPRQIRIF